MGLTSKQRRILESLSGADSKETASRLGTTVDNIHVSNTLVYQNFEAHLEAMLEFYPIFERRLRVDPKTYTKLRSLASKIRKEG